MSDYLGRIGQFISQGLVQQGMGAQGRFLANKGQAINNKTAEYELKVAPDKLKLKKDEENRLMETLYEQARQFDDMLPIEKRKVAVNEQGNVLEGQRIGEMGKERAHEVLTSTLDSVKRAGGNLAVTDAFDPATGTVNMDVLKKQVRPAIMEGANTDVHTSNRKAYGKEAANTAGERDRALAVHLGNMKQSGATDEEVAAERARYTDGTSPVKPSGTKKGMLDYLSGAMGAGLKKLAEQVANGEIDEEEAQLRLPSILRTLESAKPQQPQAEPQAEAEPQSNMYDAAANLLNRGRQMMGRKPAEAAKAAMQQWANQQSAGSGFAAYLGQVDNEEANQLMLNFVAEQMLGTGYSREQVLEAFSEVMR